mgnify:FL=1
MSRLGKAPISISKGVQVQGEFGEITFKGPKGEYKINLPNGLKLEIKDSDLFVVYDESSSLQRPMHGLYRSLVNNAVIGVSEGFSKQLSLIGVGYRAAVKGNFLDMQLGFSHPSQLPIPAGIQVSVEKNTLVTISGIDKQLVGQFAATARALRPPEPYKGKGVRYVGEYVRKKAGKSAKGK